MYMTPLLADSWLEWDDLEWMGIWVNLGQWKCTSILWTCDTKILIKMPVTSLIKIGIVYTDQIIYAI